jgi:hypothetical protein
MLAMFTADDGSYDLAAMANFASMAIWGMVVSKARSGLEAVNTKDSSKVNGLLKKTTQLISLITFASIFKLIAVLMEEPVAAPTVSTSHVLKQSRPSILLEQEHPESFYDSSSPHYMGGAHNVALAQLSDPKAVPRTPSQESLGGAHNAALYALKQQSK